MDGDELGGLTGIPGLPGLFPGSDVSWGLKPLLDRINFVRSQQPQIDVEPRILDLGTARDNVEWLVQGDSLLVATITGAMTLRFNEKDAPLHDLQVERNFTLFGNESCFYRLFLTNTAQTGKSVTLVVGKDVAFRVVQGLPATKLTDKDGADISPMEDNVLDATPTNDKADVATTTTAIIAANTARGYACLVNLSDTRVDLGFGANAVANKGISLNANGGSYEITRQNMFRGAVNGIHAGTGTKIVAFMEADEG